MLPPKLTVSIKWAEGLSGSKCKWGEISPNPPEEHPWKLAGKNSVSLLSSVNTVFDLFAWKWLKYLEEKAYVLDSLYSVYFIICMYSFPNVSHMLIKLSIKSSVVCKHMVHIACHIYKMAVNSGSVPFLW